MLLAFDSLDQVGRGLYHPNFVEEGTDDQQGPAVNQRQHTPSGVQPGVASARTYTANHSFILHFTSSLTPSRAPELPCFSMDAPCTCLPRSICTCRSLCLERASHRGSPGFPPLPHSAEKHLPEHLSTVASYHPVTHPARVHFLKSANQYVTFYYIMYLL